MTFPLQRTLEASIPAGVDDDVTEDTIVGVAPFAGTVTSVYFVPTAAITGADTDSRTFQLFNRGADGTGTTKVAELALVDDVDIDAQDAQALTLQAAGNRSVDEGDVLEFVNKHEGDGMATASGMLFVVINRDGE